MSDLISIIIPVYNIESYLDKCLNSICCQTYRNFEVLLIDDGSTDGSYTKCQEYEKKYSYIRALQQQHKGVSAARNLGIKESRGKYIAFVDGDDTIADNYLEILEKYMRKGEYEIVFCGCREINTKYKGKTTHNIVKSSSGQFQKDFMKLYLGNTRVSIGTPVCKLFSRDKIIENNLSFKEEFINHEDAIFSFSYLQYCTKYYITSETHYNYYKHGRGSATESISCQRIENEIEFLRYVENWLCDNNISEREEIVSYDMVAFIGGIVGPLKRKNNFISSYSKFKTSMNRLLRTFTFPRKAANYKNSLVLLCVGSKIYLPVFLYYWLKAFKETDV